MTASGSNAAGNAAENAAGNAAGNAAEATGSNASGKSAGSRTATGSSADRRESFLYDEDGALIDGVLLNDLNAGLLVQEVDVPEGWKAEYRSPVVRSDGTAVFEILNRKETEPETEPEPQPERTAIVGNVPAGNRQDVNLRKTPSPNGKLIINSSMVSVEENVPDTVDVCLVEPV